MKSPIRAVLALSCTVAALVPVAAQAAPVTVNLRIEGKDRTLWEGPITTDGRTIDGVVGDDSNPNDAPSPHLCNNYDNNFQSGANSGTPTTAAYDAMSQLGLPFDATWYNGQSDFFINTLGDPSGGAPNFESWGFAVNYSTSNAGGCRFVPATGADVLWAWDFFNKTTLLKLTGPAAVTAGEPATFRVVDGQTGAGLANATVGGRTTDANGNVSLTFAATGTQSLKAERAASIRSNRLDVNVGAKGQPTPPPAPLPGTPTGAPADTTKPLARISAPRDKVTYRSRFAPRRLSASVAEDGSGVTSVRMRLTRQVGSKCWQFSLKRERFVGIRCGKGTYAEVTRQASFEYLLPSRLPRGRYVFDVTASDRAANVDTFRSSGRNRVVFTVK